MSRADIANQIKQARGFRSVPEKAFVSLIKTNDMVVAAEESVFRQAGITFTQYNVLRILRGSHPDGLPVMEVGSRMLSRVPDVTRLLNRMERNGLIERHRGKVDRRSIIVRLSAKGMDSVNGLDPVVSEMQRRLFDGLSDDELDAFCRVLEKLRENAMGLEESNPPVGE
ncbi:MarR family transcriptional regulator [bacterium]|nr:MarR family transcriptional regulator [bacterium]